MAIRRNVAGRRRRVVVGPPPRPTGAGFQLESAESTRRAQMRGGVGEAVRFVAFEGGIVAIARDVLNMQRCMPTLAHRGELGTDLRGTLRTRAEREAAARFARRRAQVQNASQGVTAPNRALGPGEELQLADAGEGQGREIELRAARRIVQRHAVEQHQQMIGLRPAHPRLGKRPATAGRGKREARQRTQRINAEQQRVRFEVVLGEQDHALIHRRDPARAGQHFFKNFSVIRVCNRGRTRRGG